MPGGTSGEVMLAARVKNKTLDAMPPAAGRKARFAGKDPQSQSATQADLLYL